MPRQPRCEAFRKPWSQALYFFRGVRRLSRSIMHARCADRSDVHCGAAACRVILDCTPRPSSAAKQQLINTTKAPGALQNVRETRASHTLVTWPHHTGRELGCRSDCHEKHTVPILTSLLLQYRRSIWGLPPIDPAIRTCRHSHHQRSSTPASEPSSVDCSRQRAQSSTRTTGYILQVVPERDDSSRRCCVAAQKVTPAGSCLSNRECSQIVHETSAEDPVAHAGGCCEPDARCDLHEP